MVQQEIEAIRRIGRLASRQSLRLIKARVRIKRRLRRLGISPAWDASTAHLIALVARAA